MKISKDDLRSLCLRFWKFLPNFIVTVVFFVMIGLVPGVFIGKPVQWGLEYLGVSHQIAFIIFRIIGSVSPLSTAIVLWKNRNKPAEEEVEGTIMDCFFAMWIFWLVTLWVFL